MKLTLFVRTGESGVALSSLYKALEFHSFTDYELNIVDVQKEPTAGKVLGIGSTPALLKHLELGDIHYAGDFSDFEKMRSIFGFRTTPVLFRQ